jgi:hypothetical protein
MTMWPMDKHPLPGPNGRPAMGARHSHHGGRAHGPPIPPMGAMGGGRPGRPLSGMMGGGIPPPPMWVPGGGRRPDGPEADVVNVTKPSKSGGKGKGSSAMLGFFAGKPTKKKSKK